jgi:hypothetical protein
MKSIAPGGIQAAAMAIGTQSIAAVDKPGRASSLSPRPSGNCSAASASTCSVGLTERFSDCRRHLTAKFAARRLGQAEHGPNSGYSASPPAKLARDNDG